MQGDKRRWCTWRKERRAKKIGGSGRGGRHPGTRGGVPTPPNNTRGLTIPISCCRKPYAIRKANLRSNKSYKAPKGRPDLKSRESNLKSQESNLRSKTQSQIAEDEFQNEKSISDRKIHLRSKTQSQIAGNHVHNQEPF